MLSFPRVGGGGGGIPGSARTVGKETSEAIIQAKQNQGFDDITLSTCRLVRILPLASNNHKAD